MIVIGINTALANAQVSILNGGNIISSFTDDRPFSQATSITGLIKSAISEANISFSDIDIIGCAIGPGSFTGIRIGIAAAKGLEISLNKPLIGVNVFDAVAQSYPNEAISVLIDSRRGDFFCQDFINGKAASNSYIIANENINNLKNKPVHAESEQIISANVCRLTLEKFNNNELSPAVPMYIREADVTICKK